MLIRPFEITFCAVIFCGNFAAVSASNYLMFSAAWAHEEGCASIICNFHFAGYAIFNSHYTHQISRFRESFKNVAFLVCIKHPKVKIQSNKKQRRASRGVVHMHSLNSRSGICEQSEQHPTLAPGIAECNERDAKLRLSTSRVEP